jgi:hypothetical protein
MGKSPGGAGGLIINAFNRHPLGARIMGGGANRSNSSMMTQASIPGKKQPTAPSFASRLPGT